MIDPDPEYDFVTPWEKFTTRRPKKGSQCGECGMKFDYGLAYGYCCGNSRCPMGFGPSNLKPHSPQMISGGTS
jgi:hypothetical protein